MLFAAALLVAEERPLAPPSQGLPAGHQLYPAVASDGIGFLVVWKDEKVFYGPPVTMLAEHFDAAGGHGGLVVLDQRSGPPFDNYTRSVSDTPRVVWTGSVYLVAWYDSSRNSVLTSRLDREGHLIDYQPRSSGIAGSVIGAASSASRTMVVTSNVGSGSHLLFFDANGEPAGPSSRLPNTFTPLNVSANARGLLLLYDEVTSPPGFSVIHVTNVAAISPEGVRGTAHEIHVGGPYTLTSNGNDYLLTSGPQAATRYRLDDTGTVVGGLQKADETPADIPPVATAYLDGWLVALESSSGVRGLRVDRDGRYLADVPISSTQDYAMALVSNGSVAFYAHVAGYGRQIFGHVIGVSQDAPIEAAPPAQFSASIAAGKNGSYAAVWSEDQGTYEVHFTRLDAHGNTLDGSGLVFTQRSSFYASDVPSAIGFDGAHYLVAWLDPAPSYGCDVKILHIGADGTFPDTPVSRVIAHDCVDPIVIGSAPDRTLLIWGAHLLALDQGGSPLGPVSVVSSGGRGIRDYSIVWNRDRWLLVWTSVTARPTPSPDEYDIYGIRIDATGRPLDPEPFSIASLQHEVERLPSVAAGDNEFLVAWQAAGAAQPDTPHIMTRRIPLSGIDLPDPVKLVDGSNPAVARQGNDYVLAYLDAGQIWLTTLTHPSVRQAITSSPELRTNLKLAAGPDTLAALYIRSAMAWPYLGAPTAFFQLLGPARRHATSH